MFRAINSWLLLGEAKVQAKALLQKAAGALVHGSCKRAFATWVSPDSEDRLLVRGAIAGA